MKKSPRVAIAALIAACLLAALPFILAMSQLPEPKARAEESKTHKVLLTPPASRLRLFLQKNQLQRVGFCFSASALELQEISS